MTPARTGFGLAALIFLLDQCSKWAALRQFERLQTEVIDLLPIFRLVRVRNEGISGGLLVATSAPMRWLLVATTSAICIGAALWLARETKRIDALGLGFIVGGAAGNILDRARLGYVFDFLNLHLGKIDLGFWHTNDFQPFLVFNVADSAITVGIMMLLARAIMAGNHATKTDSDQLEKLNA